MARIDYYTASLSQRPVWHDLLIPKVLYFARLVSWYSTSYYYSWSLMGAPRGEGYLSDLVKYSMFAKLHCGTVAGIISLKKCVVNNFTVCRIF